MSGGKDQKDTIKTTSNPWDPTIPYLTGGTGRQLRNVDKMTGKMSKLQNRLANTSNVKKQGKLQGKIDALSPLLESAQGQIDAAAPGALLPEAQRQYQEGPGFHTPFDPAQQQGQESALNYAQQFGQMFQPYMQAGQQALNAPDIANNPYLEQYMQAATRPLEQQLSFGTLPGIRSQYTGAGQYGSSRQGVSEGVARGLTNQAIGDTRAQIASQGYGQGLDQQARALALYPQMMQSGLMPSQIQSGVGAERQQNANLQQTDTYKKLAQYAGLLNPLYNIGGTVSQPSYSGGWLGNAAGGAISGAGVGSQIGGGTGAGWGAGIGALLGLFS